MEWIGLPGLISIENPPLACLRTRTITTGVAPRKHVMLWPPAVCIEGKTFDELVRFFKTVRNPPYCYDELNIGPTFDVVGAAFAAGYTPSTISLRISEGELLINVSDAPQYSNGQGVYKTLWGRYLAGNLVDEHGNPVSLKTEEGARTFFRLALQVIIDNLNTLYNPYRKQEERERILPFLQFYIDEPHDRPGPGGEYVLSLRRIYDAIREGRESGNRFFRSASIQTQLTIGANDVWATWPWEADVSERTVFYAPYADSIWFSGYNSPWNVNDQSAYWRDRYGVGELRGKFTSSWISLQEDKGEYVSLLGMAEQLHWDRIGVFGGDMEAWRNCDDFLAEAARFCATAAHRHWLGSMGSTIRTTEFCKLFPDCKKCDRSDDTLWVPMPGLLPAGGFSQERPDVVPFSIDPFNPYGANGFPFG